MMDVVPWKYLTETLFYHRVREIFSEREVKT